MKFRIVLASAVMLAALSPALADDTEYDEHDVTVPVTDDNGERTDMVGKVCVPADADGKPRLVIINHGSPANGSDRPKMQLGSCDSEVAQWFLGNGYAVMYVLRRGYGDTGGEWAEAYGPCNDPDYFTAGRESARDVDAMVHLAGKLGYVRPDGIVVAGVSAGGWATTAFNSVPHPKVAAIINMAGGRGGHRNGEKNNNCTPDMLADAMARFGRTSTTPMLWIYARNDSFFRPQIADAMYAAFTGAGGKAEYHALGPQGSEGHSLWSMDGGSDVWGPLVEAYLKKRGAWDGE